MGCAERVRPASSARSADSVTTGNGQPVWSTRLRLADVVCRRDESGPDARIPAILVAAHGPRTGWTPVGRYTTVKPCRSSKLANPSRSRTSSSAVTTLQWRPKFIRSPALHPVVLAAVGRTRERRRRGCATFEDCDRLSLCWNACRGRCRRGRVRDQPGRQRLAVYLSVAHGAGCRPRYPFPLDPGKGVVRACAAPPLKKPHQLAMIDAARR